MKLKYKFLLLSCLMAFILSGCKPTEKGYKTAYDAALNKRQTAIGDVDATIPTDEIQEVDGIQLKEIDGEKVYLLNQRIRPAEGGTPLPGNYNVCVGRYKMITNCKAQVNALKEQNFQAFSAEDSDGMYYVIVASFQNIKDAIKFEKEYRKGKNRVYVGLRNAPVIIFSPK